VRIELVIDDSITDVVARGFDAGIWSVELVHQDMVAIRMTPDLRMAVVGAPAYLATLSMLAMPDDLRGHRWRFTGPAGAGDVDVDVVGAMTANDTEIAICPIAIGKKNWLFTGS
jgi:hypothetical protein